MTITTGSNGTRHAALVEWQARQAEGVELTGAELAQRFGKSPSWGRQVAREARTATAPTAPYPASELPAVEPAAPKPSVANDGFTHAEEVSPWVGRVTVLAVLAVALAAAVASFDHLATLARLAGEDGRAWLLPVSVDGLVVASSMVLYSASRSGRAPGVLPVAALALGLTASVAGNVIAVSPELIEPGHLKIAVAAWPPLALALAFDMALRGVRAGSKGTGQ